MTRILAAFVLIASPACADVIGPGGKVQDCFCTDTSGARVELGETVIGVPAELSLDGSASLAGGEGEVDIRADRARTRSHREFFKGVGCECSQFQVPAFACPGGTCAADAIRCSGAESIRRRRTDRPRVAPVPARGH